MPALTGLRARAQVEQARGRAVAPVETLEPPQAEWATRWRPALDWAQAPAWVQAVA